MTTPQILAFLTIAGMMVAFMIGRWRYDLVAVCALLIALLVGIVPAEEAFSGFANDIVIIVASPALLDVECKTPRQMRLVNALCGAVEAAGEQPPGAFHQSTAAVQTNSRTRGYA